MSISAIILSAGSSRRMGKPKALLQIGKKTFLQHVIDTVTLAGLTNTIVVLGCEPVEIQETLTSFNGKIIINAAWERGQLSSIIAAVNVLKQNECEGVLIFPVDHPLISTSLIQKLLTSFHESKKKIVIPTLNERRGHPVMISSVLFEEIKNASLDVGLREVIRSHETDIELVPTEEEGILINIDTPEEYQKYIGN